MLTFKQMEALYWIVQLGSFEAASSRLKAKSWLAGVRPPQASPTTKTS